MAGAREQHREQRIFLRARGVDLVDTAIADIDTVAGKIGRIAVEIGPQNDTAHAGRGFHRQHALGGNARPVRDRRLRDANFSGKRADTAGNADRFVKTAIAHQGFFFIISIRL